MFHVKQTTDPIQIMNNLVNPASPFPHDLSYDTTYDADNVNGELFSTTDDLSRASNPANPVPTSSDTIPTI